jgi:hypothetical protein
MVEQDILAALTGGSPTLVGDRIYAHVLPDGASMPAVTYGRVSTVAANHLGGHGGLDLVRVQIDCWAETYDEAKSVASGVRVLVQAAPLNGLLANEFEDYEPDTERYRVSSDYTVWQRT